MATLIVIFSKKIEQHKYIYETINSYTFDKIYAVCDNSIINEIKEIPNLEKVGIDFSNEKESFEKLLIFFKQITEFEVACDLTSSTGRKDMLIIQALIKSGLGFKFVKSKNSQLIEFGSY